MNASETFSGANCRNTQELKLSGVYNGHKWRWNMENVVTLVVALVFLSWGAGGIQPNGGYCIKDHCFTVFQNPRDFITAQNECESLDGHLMTVRSSVSHGILVILLGNATGGFWIGLHLPAGCPDAAAVLKGFQWVTQDRRSDFSDWAPGFDSSCSCHRCVSVSNARGLKWTQEPCDEPAAGFVCEHSFSDTCGGVAGVARGETVTYATPLGFGGEELLSLPHGSVAVQRPSGRKHICVSGLWLQGPWSCEIEKGGCEHKCALSSKNVPTCSCPKGETVSPANKVACETAADDPCLSLRCDHNCQHDGDAYACVCDPGFQLGEDSRSCRDLDECADRRQCPWENFKCANTVGGFECVCVDGYQMKGRQCVDFDECASAPCEHACANTPGSYRCTCSPGYTVDPESPNNCQLHCGADECPAECDPNDDSQCNCPAGYISEERDEGTFCLDIDECASDHCEQGCDNTFGGYVCTCRPGFTLQLDKFRCKVEDHTDRGGYSEWPEALNTPTTPFVPPPGPTKKPSAVSKGGLAGIIVCTVIVVVLVVFLVHRVVKHREKMESAPELKPPEGEAHSLERVASAK